MAQDLTPRLPDPVEAHISAKPSGGGRVSPYAAECTREDRRYAGLDRKDGSTVLDPYR